MGGSSKKQTVGYRYFLGMHMILCHGPADRLLRIRADEKTAWLGANTGGQIYVGASELFGGESREGGISGYVDVEMGESSQGQNSYLVSKLGSLVPAFRGVVGTVLRQCYLGVNPYLKKWDFRLQRIHKRQNGIVQWYDEKSAIAAKDTSNAIDFNNNFMGTGGGATAATAPGCITVSGVSTEDFLIIEIPENPTYKAFSFFASDAESYAAGLKPWATALTVACNGSETTYNQTRYDTQDESLAYARQNPIYVTGASEYKIYIKDDFASNNRGGISVRVLVAKYFDMNPAHIIRECLTDPDWGMGYQDADIDDASFISAADILHSEEMGISVLWDRQASIEDFVKEIVKHIDAALYVERSTGKFVLKLIRKDYDVNSLITLDESNIDKISDFVRPAFGELTNSITVNFWDSATSSDSSLTVQDIALAQMQGVTINTTVQYPGFTKKSLAARVAQRDLKTLSTPLASCMIYANRDAASLNIGSCFKLSWADYDMNEVVMRVTGIAYGDGKSNRVRINCAQDVFSLPEASFIAPTPPVWEDPNSDATPAIYRVVTEAPYYELVQRLGQTNADQQISANNEIGYLLVSAAAPNGAINGRIAVDNGAGYDDNDYPMDFCPVAFCSSDVDYDDTVINVNNFVGSSAITIGSHAQIGNELVKVTAVASDSVTVGRGVLDTVPSFHAAGTSILFWDAYADSDNTEYVKNESILVKVLPTTGRGTLALSDAPEDSLTFVARAFLPYPPGKLQVNSLAYPSTIAGSAELSISWAHRDRLQQTAGDIVDTTAGNIGPESGTTYEVKIYNENDSLVRTVSGLTGTSYTYPAASEASDSGLSNGGDMNWSSRNILLNCNGSDGSSLITDEKGHMFTASGNAKISTSDYKYGGASLKFPGGSSDYVECDYSTSDFDWWSQDTTIEFWINSASQGIRPCVIGNFDKASDTNYWSFGLINGNQLQFYYWKGSVVTLTSPSAVPSGWVHCAVTFEFSTKILKLWVNGVNVASLTTTGTPLSSTSVKLTMGRQNSVSMNSYVDDLRFSRRLEYNSTFTPPSSQFANFQGVGRDFNGKLRFTLQSVRNGYSSFQKHDYTVSRTGYGFNYGERYGS